MGRAALEWKLFAGLAGVTLALACIADYAFFPALPWVLALYTLPLIVCVALPVGLAVAVAGSTLIAALAVAFFGEGPGAAPERLVSFAQILLLSAMVVYVRAARDEVDRSNERVAGILDGSDTGFVRMNADLTVREVNGPWLRLVGARRASEVVDTTLPQWFPEDRRRAAEAMLAFLDEGARRSFETELRHANGSRIAVVVTAYAERVGDEVILAAVFADVSAIRRAEAEARASEAQLRSHLQRTPLAAVVLDASHRIRDWNDAAERVFGYSRSEALGMSAWKLVPEAERGTRTVPFGDTDTTARQGGFERVEQCTRDGRQILLQWYHTPISTADGQLERIASLGLDVTHSQRMERALRESETKFASVFHESPDAQILVRIRDNTLLEINDTTSELFGWTLAEMQARWGTVTDFWASAEDCEQFLTLMRTERQVEAFETRLMANDGRAIPSLVSARRLRVGDATVVLMTVRDFTAIREAEARRRELEQQLQQAQRLEGIGRLAGGVAHDFNNMLAGVQGYAELIEGQAGQRSQVEHYASRILDTTRRAADLVGKLLAFSRQGALEKHYFDIQRLVRDTTDLVAQTMDAGIRIDCRTEAPVCAVYGDESQISNAVLNLCVNARDAVDRRGTIRIDTELRPLDARSAAQLDPDLPAGEYVVVRVTDDGCGIAESALEHIFVPFFTTKVDGRGTGLGLASVYGAAKGHGGTVRVESREGDGSTFSLWLPAWPASMLADAQDAPRSTAPLDLSGRHVLVVDDEESVRDTLARTLEGLGAVVQVAADGRQGIAAFCEDPERWALVLLDVSLPELSGVDVWRALAEQRPQPPVLFMSGYDQTARLQEALADGVAGVLAKPFSREELLVEVERVLGGGRGPRLRLVGDE